VQSFVSRLREKGFESHVSGGGVRRGGSTNEVLIGTFGSQAEADSLAAQAKSKNLSVSVYRAGAEWRVSAGTFADMEDAAQMLDRVEDAGFRSELARRPGTGGNGGSGLRAIRTGRFSTRQEAAAERARVVAAGFPGAFVVAEPRR
jgi:cell division septation protein DedD